MKTRELAITHHLGQAETFLTLASAFFGVHIFICFHSPLGYKL